jgi:hypothetical protein
MDHEQAFLIRRAAMIARGCVVLLVALACATSLTAQARGGKAKAPDAITGTWTGELLPSGAPSGRSVRLELQHDGKGKVTGTMAGMPNPADVKTGTFDAKTRALKLQLGKQDDPTVLLVLDGTVAKNTVTGRISGEVSGEFTLSKTDKPK